MGMSEEFGYGCEYCDGVVAGKRVDREAFKHKNRFVILEGVVIGVCDKCGNRYYSAKALRLFQSIATGETPPEHTEEVPVAREG